MATGTKRTTKRATSKKRSAKSSSEDDEPKSGRKSKKKTKKKPLSAKGRTGARPQGRSTGSARRRAAKLASSEEVRLREKPLKKVEPRSLGSNNANLIAKEYFASEDREWTPALVRELKLAFLRAYARDGIESDGTLAAGITHKIYRQWRADDPEFDTHCEHAAIMAADALERGARKRALHGYEKPIVHMGEITDTYIEYSDTLMAILLKGNKPEKFRERVSTENKSTVTTTLTVDKETKDDVVKSILGMIRNKPDPK